MNYIYPKLPAKYTYPWFRIGGNGLANCLFVYARAIISSQKHKLPIIAPAWFNLSVGPYIRNEADKRHYLNLINSNGEISGLKKCVILLTHKKNDELLSFDENDENTVIVVNGLKDYFKSLLYNSKLVSKYLNDHINPSIIEKVNTFDFKKCIAVHIRLGDYSKERRTPLEWYAEKIKSYPESDKYKFLIFSDGDNKELSSILKIPNVQKVFFGNALADIIAISRCCYLFASDSTFSAWGAYLGQVPSCFYKRHFGQVLDNSQNEIVEMQY